MKTTNPVQKVKKTPNRPLSLSQIKSKTQEHLTPLTAKLPWFKKPLNSASTGSTLVAPKANSDDEDAKPAANDDVAKTKNEALTVVPKDVAVLQSIETHPVSEAALVAAVDCSGSTAGMTLLEEKAAISNVASGLSKDSRSRMMVLPWSHEAESALSLDEMGDIFSSGGTDPTVLIQDKHYLQALSRSSLWMILTDGLIDESAVRSFAMGIGENGLHGISSIVVCFGSTFTSPITCNISVGKSVFGVASDCLFLYHDTDTSTVYILQCKGHFNVLYNDGDIILDENTTWNDLPTITYEDLHNIEIPKPQKLAFDSIRLASGRTLDLNQIYRNTLDAETTAEILNDNDNLKTLLLTAATRGKKPEVKRWISKKKLQISDPLWVTRPDIDHKAFLLIGELIKTIKDDAGTDIRPKQKMLQQAHDENWGSFIAPLKKEREEARIRLELIEDVTFRLELDDDAPHSPALLSPVSPTYSQSRPSRNTLPDAAMDYPSYAPHMNPPSAPRKSRHAKWRPSSARNQKHSQLRPSGGAEQGADSPELSVLYTPGYKSTSADIESPDDSFKGLCTLCNRDSVILSLLLRKPADVEPTPNFPRPEQDAKHKYPFVLGIYPDVDNVAPELYCEACTHFLVRHGKSGKSEKVLGALPLVKLYGHTDNINLDSWLDTLAKVFQWRFSDSIVLSVFLSVLYNTLDDLLTVDAHESATLMRAIQWACRNLLRSILVSKDFTSIPLGETPRDISPAETAQPLHKVIPGLVTDAVRGHGPFLTYPLDGFFVMMMAAKSLDSEQCSRSILTSVVWIRFAVRLAEQHFIAINEKGIDEASRLLLEIIETKKPAESSAGTDSTTLVKKCPIAMASIEDTHLLPTDDLETFQRLGNLFSSVSAKCGAALAVYLHYLHESAQTFSDPMVCFDHLITIKALRRIFVAPEDLDDAKAADLIARVKPVRV